MRLFHESGSVLYDETGTVIIEYSDFKKSKLPAKITFDEGALDDEDHILVFAENARPQEKLLRPSFSRAIGSVYDALTPREDDTEYRRVIPL